MSSRTQRGLVRSDDSSKPLSEQPVSPHSSQVVSVIAPTVGGVNVTADRGVIITRHNRPSAPTCSSPAMILRVSLLCSRCIQGLCVPKGASYSCRCSEGYQGPYCDRRQEPPACRGSRCGHGECRVAESGEPVCHCQPGYTGPTCDTGNTREDGDFIIIVIQCLSITYNTLFMRVFTPIHVQNLHATEKW